MKLAHGLAAVLVVLTAQAAAEAQFLAPVAGPIPAPFGGVRFAYRGRHFALGGAFGSPYFWGGFAGSPFFGYPPFGMAAPNVTVVYSPPPPMMNPVIIINQPIVVIRDKQVDVTEDDRYIRIVPRSKQAPGKAKPEKAEPPKDKLRPPVPEARKPEPTRRLPARPPAPPPLEGGKEAFALQMHGLAERLFQRAATTPPVDPQAHFLLGQARFALAKYQEAVRAIEAGLKLKPDWPSAPFRPAELYGPNAEDFAAHLRRLEETLTRHPNDPDLLFLYAYELWFAGRRDEARALFRRAAKVTPDTRFIELFVPALGGGVVARRHAP